jgi:hypothetical protein
MKESGENKTWFDGQLFRSSPEARWRLFFSEMDLGCDYRQEPVEFDSEIYEPDFFLSQGMWIIVKGTFPTTEEKSRACSLAEHSGYPVYLFFGEIPDPNPHDQSWYTASALAFFADGTMDEAYWWCECPISHSAGIQFEGRAANLPCGCLRSSDPSHCHSERILNAYRVARKAELTSGATDEHDELKKHRGLLFY